MKMGLIESRTTSELMAVRQSFGQAEAARIWLGVGAMQQSWSSEALWSRNKRAVGGRDGLSSGSGKSERRETSQARQRQGGFLGCHREDGEAEHG